MIQIFNTIIKVLLQQLADILYFYIYIFVVACPVMITNFMYDIYKPLFLNLLEVWNQL